MPFQKLRAVFDCNIFIQALLNPKSAAAKCLDLAREQRFDLFVSKSTLDEFRDVIFRPKILAKLRDADINQIEAFIEDILKISEYLKTTPKIFIFERDPKDEIIIDLAVACEADYIVSRDNDLLDLMNGFDDSSKEFRQRFRPLKVVEPVDFLQILTEKDLSVKP